MKSLGNATFNSTRRHSHGPQRSGPAAARPGAGAARGVRSAARLAAPRRGGLREGGKSEDFLAFSFLARASKSFRTNILELVVGFPKYTPISVRTENIRYLYTYGTFSRDTVFGQQSQLAAAFAALCRNVRSMHSQLTPPFAGLNLPFREWGHAACHNSKRRPRPTPPCRCTIISEGPAPAVCLRHPVSRPAPPF